MTNPPQSEFSFNLYPGLDADLEAAYERNIATGLVSPEDMATSGLAAAVQQNVGNVAKNPASPITPEAKAWAEEELNNITNTWFNLEIALGMKVPYDMEQLSAQHTNLEQTLQRLFSAKQALIASNEVTTAHENIGETMKLVMVPWKAMLNNLPRFDDWLRQVRTAQGITANDFINLDLLEAVEHDESLYRNPHAAGGRMSAGSYLEQQISEHGNWGVMLVQASNQAGVRSLIGKSPDELTNRGEDNLIVGGRRVDALGIFEWIALSIQENPRELSPNDYSWLLANRLTLDDSPYVPTGQWLGLQVKWRVDRADNQDDDTRPRLAVM